MYCLSVTFASSGSWLNLDLVLNAAKSPDAVLSLLSEKKKTYKFTNVSKPEELIASSLRIIFEESMIHVFTVYWLLSEIQQNPNTCLRGPPGLPGRNGINGHNGLPGRDGRDVTKGEKGVAGPQVGSITSRCSGKEPAHLPFSGRVDQTRESGGNRA